MQQKDVHRNLYAHHYHEVLGAHHDRSSLSETAQPGWSCGLMQDVSMEQGCDRLARLYQGVK